MRITCHFGGVSPAMGDRGASNLKYLAPGSIFCALSGGPRARWRVEGTTDCELVPREGGSPAMRRSRQSMPVSPQNLELSFRQSGQFFPAFFPDRSADRRGRCRLSSPSKAEPRRPEGPGATTRRAPSRADSGVFRRVRGLHDLAPSGADGSPPSLSHEGRETRRIRVADGPSNGRGQAGWSNPQPAPERISSPPTSPTPTPEDAP